MHSGVNVAWKAPKSGNVLACLCEYRGSMKGLLAELKGFRKGDIMQAFSYSKEAEGALLPAYVNAKLRASEGMARAKDTNMDFMLLVARTMKIDRALAKYGASSQRFVFFSENRRRGRSFLKKHGVRIIKELELRFDRHIAEDVALSELLEK